jgi:hypothetical protein
MKSLKLLVILTACFVCSVICAEQAQILTLACNKPSQGFHYWKPLSEINKPEESPFLNQGLRYENLETQSSFNLESVFEQDFYSLPGEDKMTYDSNVYEGGGKYGEDVFFYYPIESGKFFAGIGIISKYPLQVSGIQPDEISAVFSFGYKLR